MGIWLHGISEDKKSSGGADGTFLPVDTPEEILECKSRFIF